MDQRFPRLSGVPGLPLLATVGDVPTRAGAATTHPAMATVGEVLGQIWDDVTGRQQAPGVEWIWGLAAVALWSSARARRGPMPGTS